jgi:hypothetical protein
MKARTTARPTSRCETAGRRRRRLPFIEVPASLVPREVDWAKSGNLSSHQDPMSRARNMDQTFEHDPELASELRDSAGREISEEAAEDERLTALHDRRRFTMSEAAKEMANRGDRVAVECAGHSFSGALVSAGADYAVIEGSGLRSEIRLDAGYWSLIPAAQGASPGTTTNETLAARLREHADTGAMLRIAVAGGELVIGKVTVVAEDHVEIDDADGRRIYVPMRMILAVTKSVEFH